MNRKLYQHIASLLQAIENCKKTGNKEWEDRHSEVIEKLCKDNMPSGSGVDNGTKLSDRSTPERLVFDTAFHHMNDAGFYDGWTAHTVIVTPSLSSDFNLHITGRDRNQIKDYLADIFQIALSEEIDRETLRPVRLTAIRTNDTPA